MKNSKQSLHLINWLKVKMLIEQYVADGTRMIDVDATLNDIKQHTQFIINEILAIKLPAEATVVSSKVSKSVPKLVN